jgi:signal transduction histidine kinase
LKGLKVRSVFHIYVIFFVLFLGLLAAGFGMVLYNITIQKPDGQIGITRWPLDFARDFSEYILFDEDGVPGVRQAGLDLLLANRAWIQILDSNGEVVRSFNTPGGVPGHYSPANLLALSANGLGSDSVFAGSVRSGDQTWTYLVGLPVPVSTVTTYVNKDRFNTLKPIFWGLFAFALALLVVSTVVYSWRVTRQMDRMRVSIREIASRTYRPARNEGLYGDLYGELNRLNAEIKASDEVRAKNEKLREEWIANITHDLKTPLSPIRGYAELIADPETQTGPDEIRQYGGIILKNAAYAEELINDLKLTFQLKNEMLSLNRQTENIVRFLRELVIDLLNSPDYRQREISFYSSSDSVLYSFDAIFMRRAFNNLITNALVHNLPETEVAISLRLDERIRITIQDNGRGMSPDELEQLFVRYYRGNNTGSKPEGTGLGMAIARQIVEQHGGKIAAESQPGLGTCVMVEFPIQEEKPRVNE